MHATDRLKSNVHVKRRRRPTRLQHICHAEMHRRIACLLIEKTGKNNLKDTLLGFWTTRFHNPAFPQ